LSAGYVVRITALDQTTGNVVSGVTLSEVSFFVTDVGQDATTTGTEGSGPLPEPGPLLVPLDDNA
jgi:hypothetical protein